MVQEYEVVVWASSSFWANLISSRHDFLLMILLPLQVAGAIWAYRQIQYVKAGMCDTRRWLRDDLLPLVISTDVKVDELAQHKEMLEHMAKMRAAKAAKKQAAQAS